MDFDLRVPCSWLIWLVALLPLHPTVREGHLALCPHLARDPPPPCLPVGRANAPHADIRCAIVVAVRKPMRADSGAQLRSPFRSNLRLHFLPVRLGAFPRAVSHCLLRRSSASER